MLRFVENSLLNVEDDLSYKDNLSAESKTSSKNVILDKRSGEQYYIFIEIYFYRTTKLKWKSHSTNNGTLSLK